MWTRLRQLARRVFRSRAIDQSLNEEIQSFVAHDIEQRVRSGVPPAEARRAALAEFGGVEQVKDKVRDVRIGAWFDGVRQDLRYAVRSLTKSPGFSLSVIGSLSLGMAAMVATVAFINAMFVRSYPGVSDPAGLVQIRVQVAEGDRCIPPPCWNQNTTLQDFAALRAGIPSLQSLAGIETSVQLAALLPEPRSLSAGMVSANYFDVLGTSAAIGRTFTRDEDDPAHAAVAVLSHALWRGEFSSASSAIGRTIRVGERTVEIVGVMPEGFGGIGQSLGTPGPALWLPLTLADEMARAKPEWQSRLSPGQRWIQYVGRLAPSANLVHVQREANAVAAEIAASRPSSQSPRSFTEVLPLRMHDRRRIVPLVAVLVPVPLLVLMIACVNAANLLLARGSTRGRELAIRLAIGAGRRRVIRQLLVESVLLALASTLCALPLATVGLRAAEGVLAVPMPIDPLVIAGAVAMALVSAIGFGLIPAVRATNRHPARSLTASQGSEGTPGRSRGRRALVVAQVALSLGLLAVGTHLVDAVKSSERRAGTDPDHLLIASFDLTQVSVPAGGYSRFYNQVLERVGATPDVEAVGLAAATGVWVLRGGRAPDNSVVTWAPDTPPRNGRVVIGGYAGGQLLKAVGLEILQGRGFTDDELRAQRPTVAVVNTPYAEQLLKGQALGQRVRVASRINDRESSPESIEVQVVGVFEPATEPTYSRDGKPTPAMYLPAPLRDDAALALYVRSRIPASEVAPLVRNAVRQVDARVPTLKMESLAQMNEAVSLPERLMARAAAFLGFVALVLATWGLYAVVSYLVVVRSGEIAVRIALGARPLGMLLMVMRQSITMTTIGVLIGAAAAYAIGRVIQAEMHAAAGTDLVALTGSIGWMFLATLVAAIVPSWRASRVNPVVLLKDQ